MEKINIAELLKNCPSGMELDCTMFDDSVKVVFDSIDEASDFVKILIIRNNTRTTYSVSKYGQWTTLPYAKCVIFPKGKTTWEGFVPPSRFKEGDIVVTGNKYKCVAIFKSAKRFYDHEGFNYYVLIPLYIKEETLRTDDWVDGVDTRLASEEEKQKLFDTIKEHGYKWNLETKTLEKLVEPEFKVGDCIRLLVYNNVTYTVIGMTDTHYTVKSNGKYVCEYSIPISTQDKYELVPNKFDITTLKPFSEVLVRYDNDNPWMTAHFSHYAKDVEWELPYFASGSCFRQCIPYKGNEHLCGKKDDCDDFYKTWK